MLDEYGNETIIANPIPQQISKVLPEGIQFVVNEDTELGQKIFDTTYFEPIIVKGNLIDIKPIDVPKYEPTVEQKIAILQQQLTDSDYQAIKYAEGWLTDDEYEPIRLQRQEW